MPNLIPEENELAEALLLIAEKYGKFNEDDTGVWAGYDSAEENEVASIGVKCANCVLYRGGSECAIISAKVEPEGKCRFAIIPDGVVSVSKVFNKPPYLFQEELKKKVDELGDNYTKGYVDIADLVPTQEFLESSNLKNPESIVKPITVYIDGDGLKLVDGHHRCASKVSAGKRTIEAKIYKDSVVAAGKSPCWDGYKQVGMKEKNGRMVPNCVPTSAEAAMMATAGSKPAPKKDQIKGSDKNKKGSASDGKGVTFTEAITKSLEKKVAEHNEKAKNGRKVTLAKLKAVYRRGAGAFSTSHRPDQNRNSWAMARVNAYLKLVRSGKPNNPKYVQDNDLLPKMHPRHSEASTLSPLLASMVFALDDDSCPPATQDIVLNIENRQNAIDNVGYGPLNPDEPNEEFWQEKADRWDTTPVEASKSICGNCVFFIKTPKMLDCIAGGIEQGGSGEQNAWDAIDQADLGFCEALDFKCAASRTCNAWAAGGPIVEETNN
jgi:hypothetical protein